MNSEIRSEKEAMKARRLLPVFAFHHQTALHLFPVRNTTNKNVFTTRLKRRLQRPPAKKKMDGGCSNKKLPPDGNVGPERTRQGSEFTSCWICTWAAESRLVFNPLWQAGNKVFRVNNEERASLHSKPM